MNDWIVANINNPDFSVSDFQDIANMSIDNTLMLNREEYKKSDFIRNNPLFLDTNGAFSEDKFNQFYDNKLVEFLEFQTGKFSLGLELDLFDTDRTKDSPVKSTNFVLGRGVNPDRLKIGIEGVNVWSDPEKSRLEIALANKIWDSEKGEYREYSPNDYALFNGKKDYGTNFLKFALFEDPLVLALYDEDGTHIDPITGLEKRHKKGDYKLNEEGTYYYETLNGRSPLGKLVLSVADVITVDGTGINKYDFMDSDDIEKSVGGIIAKNVAALVPIFIGGPIGTVYSTALIAREMSKSLPMLYGMTSSLFGNTEEPKWLNKIAAMGEKFTSGTSLYAKEHMFSIENVGNLISDVALQWGLQKTIALAINKLRGSKDYVNDAMKSAEALYRAKEGTMKSLAALDIKNWKNSPLGQACIKKFLPAAEKAAKQSGLLGRDASLAYMAVISNSDVYGDAILHGATKQEAAAIALGSTLGMFALDKYLGLGELFFDDATENSVKAARRAIKNEIFGYVDDLGVRHTGIQEVFNKIKASDDTNANKLIRYIKAASDKGKKVMSNFSEDLKYHTTGFLGKAVGEGLEEVGEELVSDAAKSIYELAGVLGADTSTKDVGAWDNALARYGMSFFGGTIGGGIFYGKEALQGAYKRDKSNRDMAILIKNGHSLDLRDAVEKLRKQGKLGSTKLSAYNSEIGKGNLRVWLTTKNSTLTLNEAIAQLINDKITSIETVINNNLLGLSDEDLFKLMVLSENRFARYLEIAPITNYYLDFANVMDDVILADLDLLKALRTIDGTVNGPELTGDSRRTPELETTYLKNILEILNKYLKALERRNLFLSGDSSLDYTRKLNFAIDPVLHSQFLAIDNALLWKETFGEKTADLVSELEILNFLTNIVPKARKEAIKERLSAAWERYKDIEKTITPNLSILTSNAPLFKKWFDNFLKVIQSGTLSSEKLRLSYLTYDSRLEGESDEEYNSRNSKLIDPVTGIEESDIDFITRKNNRVLAIELLNDLKDQEWANALMEQLLLVNYLVDPITANLISREIPLRVRDIINRKISINNIASSNREIVRKLDNNLSNVKEILDITDLNITNHELSVINQALDLLGNILVSIDGITLKFSDYALENYDVDGITINDLFGDLSSELDTFDEPSRSLLIEKLLLLKGIVGDEEIASFYSSRNIGNTEGFLNHVLLIKDMSHNEILKIVYDIKNNPLYKLHNSITGSIKNPVMELVLSLAGKVLDKTLIPKITETLLTIESKYNNIDDVTSLVLDSTLIGTLENTRDALKLISTYIYAAASDSNLNNPIGHNKVMNEFTKNHSDIISNWQELPEIDSDYAIIYQQQINNWINLLDWWIDFSNKNNIQKRLQFTRTDKAFNKALWNLIFNNLESFKVSVDDRQYNLLDGISSIDTSLVDTDQVGVPVFSTEKILYKNFLNALYDSGLSVRDFLEKTKLLEKLTSDFTGVENLEVSLLNDKINEKSLTNFDKILYIATILTLDPVKFYTKLRDIINLNLKIAPITILEYVAKLGVASMNQQFRDIIGYAYDKTGDTRYAALNTTYIPGVAGAGKSLVVGKIIKAFADGEVLVAGPTDTLALSLLQSLGLTSSTTINKILRNILGDTVYTDLASDIEHITYLQNKGFTSSSKYFDAWEGKDGFGKFKLKTSFTFNLLPNNPKLLIIDEATHINTIMALVLDLYMKSVGGLLILLGDPNQRGYFNGTNGLGNIREPDIFTIRTPKLSISLRDNNILKLSNLETVTALLDLVLENLYKMSENELAGYWPTAKKLLSKFNFKVYNNLEINGDLITNSLTPELIAKINKLDKTIGFIGDANASAAYTALVNAGLKDKIKVLSLDLMLGQEFDYVVIDQAWKEPNENVTIRNFLLLLYTLMSRGREASIFIDNGLSNIIGKNIQLAHQAKAPSLNDKINGKSAVDELREKKLNTLGLYDLTSILLQGTNTEILAINPDLDFVDPDKTDSDLPVMVLLLALSDMGELLLSEYGTSEFTIPSFGDVTYMSVEVGEETSRTGKDGKEYKGNSWIINYPPEGPLRNLLAIVNNGEEAFWFKDKKNWEDLLYSVKSALIYNHGWEETRFGTTDRILPAVIRNNFNKSDWENGTYEIEIRSADGEVLPKYNGKRYIADIVFKVRNKQGRECIFDLAGINNPNTLISNLSTIKDNIRARIDEGKLSKEETDKLNNILGTIDLLATKYLNLFDTWINKFEQDLQFSLNISKAIKFNKTTWFTKRKNEDGKPAPPIRLGGRINPNSIDGKADFINLKDRNPGIVFSDVYTYSGGSADLIDLSVKGKAVVFVSSDTLLKPSELITSYINLKKDPSINTPRVRMLVLGNYGLTLSLLIDPEFIKTFLHGNEERKPFRLNFTGILMFTSLWNFRASLKKFNDALDKWKTDNNYSDDKVNTILTALLYIYDNKLTGDNLNNYLLTIGLTNLDIYNLENFNLEDCKNISMFRLGYSKNDNGFHILNFTVKDSIVYDKPKVDLAVITPNKAEQFYSLTNKILQSIVASDTRDSLGLQMLKEDNKTPWNEDELIDLQLASHRRTLSNLVKLDDNKQLVIQFDGKLIAYPLGQEWSAIPNLISSIVRTVTFYLYNPDLLTGSEQESARIYLHNKDKNTDSQLFKVLIGTWFGGSNPLLKTRTTETGHPDRSLMDMLELAFHGTTDDIHKKYSATNPLRLLEDARFKLGFLINPDISRKKASAGDYDIIKFGDQEIMFYPIETSDELFTVDVDLRASGISLDINALEEIQQEENTIQEESETPSFAELYPIANDLMNRANDAGEEFTTIEEVMDYWNRVLIPSIVDNISSYGEEALDYTVAYTREGNSDLIPISLRLYIINKVPVGETLSNISIKGDTINVKTNKGNYILSNNNYELDKIIPETVVESRFDRKVEFEGKVLSASNALLNILNTKLSEDIEEDILLEFISNINIIINLSKSQSDNFILERLKEIKNNEDYDDILIELEDNYSEVYNKIFEC